jgi:hypothetical protein
MKTSSTTTRASGTDARPSQGLCNWVNTAHCREPVEVTFESGLGYCRAHARAVQANREWLLGFFENRQLAKQRERDAKEEAAHASRLNSRRLLCGNGS